MGVRSYLKFIETHKKNCGCSDLGPENCNNPYHICTCIEHGPKRCRHVLIIKTFYEIGGHDCVCRFRVQMNNLFSNSPPDDVRSELLNKFQICRNHKHKHQSKLKLHLS